MQPIIVTVERIPKPFPKWVQALTVWPFIFVEREIADNACILLHERYHFRQQQRFLVLPWFAAYLLLGVLYAGKPANRHPMERRAYELQRACMEARK